LAKISGAKSGRDEVKNKRRVIVDGKLICLDCGPRPVSEFSTVIRKNRRYFESLCDSCRKMRCIARNHNISPSRYRELLANAGGVCAICKEPAKLCLDHCHATGQLRGLVCHRCNLALAPFDGKLEFGERVMEYLRSWGSCPMSPEDVLDGIERERRMKRIRDRAKNR
jgi:Autographiviridae endonuclease VII